MIILYMIWWTAMGIVLLEEMLDTVRGVVFVGSVVAMKPSAAQRN